jgi:hypothetical protein
VVQKTFPKERGGNIHEEVINDRKELTSEKLKSTHRDDGDENFSAGFDLVADKRMFVARPCCCCILAKV